MTDLELRDELTRLLLMVALKRSGGAMVVTEAELMSVAGYKLRVGHNPGATLMRAELVPPGDSTETGGGGAYTCEFCGAATDGSGFCDACNPPPDRKAGE